MMLFRKFRILPEYFFFIISALFFFIEIPQLSAFDYQIDKYTVDIDIRNSAYLLIPSGQAKLRLVGEEIHILATGRGYNDTEVIVNVKPLVLNYKIDIVLTDVKKIITARHHDGRIIADYTFLPHLCSAYFNNSQMGFSPEDYGITVYIPMQDWPNPSSNNVIAYDLYWKKPLPSRWIKYEKAEEYYCVKLAIPRKYVTLSSNIWGVIFNTRKSLQPLDSNEDYDKLIEIFNRIHQPQATGELH